jgi:hypothetical protein
MLEWRAWLTGRRFWYDWLFTECHQGLHAAVTSHYHIVFFFAELGLTLDLCVCQSIITSALFLWDLKIQEVCTFSVLHDWSYFYSVGWVLPAYSCGWRHERSVDLRYAVGFCGTVLSGEVTVKPHSAVVCCFVSALQWLPCVHRKNILAGW